MTGYANDDEFWESSPKLAYIRDVARARRAAPWAVLLGVLARVCVVTPPNVVVPDFVGGSYGSLNVFVAIVGKSSDGKGLAMSTARRLIRDDLGAETDTPVSGEGLATLFARREQLPADDDGERRSMLRCSNMRALLDVAEIAVLGAAMGRSGSTLLGTLTSVWSGERLGGRNVSEAKRLRVPEYGYRLPLVTGVQPGNSGILTGEDVTGLPQRMLWANILDSSRPEEKTTEPADGLGFDSQRLAALQPDPMTMNGLYQAGDYWRYRGEDGRPLYPLHVLRYPPIVAEEIDRDARARLAGTRPAGMDGHSLFCTVKTAGLLAILEQRDELLTVTEDDWQRAKYIVARSKACRDECIRSGRETLLGKRRDALADELIAKAEAQEMAEKEKNERDYGRWSKRIENALAKYDKGHEGLPGYEIKRRTGLRADEAYSTIERMNREGQLDRVGPETDKVSSRLWALPG